MKFTWIASALAVLCLAGSAQAGDAAAGAQKAGACIACHGVNGNSVNPEWPSLAGQHESYVAEQLANFKTGTRANTLMSPMAMALTDADMRDLGAHFAKQTPGGLEADPSNWKAGEKLYRGGDAKRGLPACIGCHGPQGKGNAPAKYPALRSQQGVYAYHQLKAFADGTRKSPGDDSRQIMQVVAAKLTDEEMRALASYLQGLR